MQSMELQKINEAEVAMMELVRNKRFLDLERVPIICKDIAAIKVMLEFQEKQLDKLVTQDQFIPVRTIVYGIVGTILISVIGALLTLVLRK